ncbi:MAG TPA: NAD(P)-dependent oxidoreductase [Polyangiaceae bacterium]|nr:NAD(P)-dependent oxidoreductase [Polyangiaceae bacterium]
MKIAVLGASGTIGRRIVREALQRGHSVTGIARHPSRIEAAERLRPAQADATKSDELLRVLEGHDAVISAVGPAAGESPSMLVDATRAIAAACMRANVHRVFIVGGAGSLAVKPGIELLATPDFPEAWKPIALAHREALELWRKVKEISWTYVSPAAFIEPGERTGRYRVGHDDLLVDERGQSRISAEDYAVGLLDVLEQGAHAHERITLAY